MIVPKPRWGWGDNTMRHRAVAAATMIVAAGLIGITQARLPRAVRGYHDRVGIEMSTFALHDMMPGGPGTRSGEPFGRRQLPV